MPRATKPKHLKKEFDYKAEYRVERVILDPSTINRLVECLGIGKNENLIKNMVEDVEWIVTDHKVESKNPNKPPSLASQIKLLESLQKSARALLKDFKIVEEDFCTRTILYSYMALNHMPLVVKMRKIFYDIIEEKEPSVIDPKAEYESDLKALMKFYHRVRLAHIVLNAHKKQGRAKDYNLKTTIGYLSAYFCHYNQRGEQRINQRRIKFLTSALDTAKISYPDSKSGKFYNLIKKPLHPQSSKI